jgi:hypothetical protein
MASAGTCAALERGTRRVSAELERRHALERADVLGHRGARAAEDHDIFSQFRS